LRRGFQRLKLRTSSHLAGPESAKRDTGFAELKPSLDATPRPFASGLLQVAALPIRFAEGELQVLLITSRETKRWVIPKGWPMKGKKNWAAAAQEAKEEAGILGKTYKRPIGEFQYFKARADHFDLCRVEVYVLGYEKRLEVYREKGQREARWFSLEDAAEAVQEPGLAGLLRNGDFSAYHKRAKKKPSAERRRKTRGKP
jgi:8-oxo-dGTP pyrophosphatase MutT (NUDIX family)